MTLLEMRDITKTFPGVKALDSVNLTVADGEIHAACRRERRRQVDADEGAVRRLSARQLRRRDPSTTASLPRSATSRDSEAPRHHHHPSGTGAGAAAVDCREHLSRQRARHEAASSTGPKPITTHREPAEEGRPVRSRPRPWSTTSASASSSLSRSPRRCPRTSGC